MNPTKASNSFKSIEEYGSLNAYELKSGVNRAVISRFGGQLISWEHDGRVILFENKKADLSAKTPYRGGAPICFAAFGDGKFIDGQSHSPSHGEARTTLWSIPESDFSSNGCTLSLECTSKSITEDPLKIAISYTFSENILGIAFAVKNIGHSPTPFQIAFHSYFYGSPATASVDGIGEDYLDANDGFSKKLGDLGLSSSTRVNRIYLSPAPEVILKMDNFSLSITNSNFPEIVVWNPGNEHSFKDLGEPNFLCVESGLITNPKVLNPQSEWNGKINYKVTI